MTPLQGLNTLHKAILYRAHYRGSKEADILIGGFAKDQTHALSSQEKADFATLLTFDDQVIFAWLEGRPLSSVTLSETLRSKLQAFRDRLVQS